jgi:hypothetical protein
MPTPAERDEELARLQRQLNGDDKRDAARTLLEPGESLRELGDVSVAFGDTGPVSDWQPIEPKSPGWFDRAWAFGTRTTLRKVVFSIALAPLFLFMAIASVDSGSIFDRIIGGRTCAGPRGSLARQVEHALSTLGLKANGIVLSDRRMLLVRTELSTESPRYTHVMAVALGDIAAARHRPRGLLRRRVELRFTDGSRIVFALPMFNAPSPERFLAALAPVATA